MNSAIKNSFETKRIDVNPSTYQLLQHISNRSGNIRLAVCAIYDDTFRSMYIYDSDGVGVRINLNLFYHNRINDLTKIVLPDEHFMMMKRAFEHKILQDENHLMLDNIVFIRKAWHTEQSANNLRKKASVSNIKYRRNIL